MPFLILAKKTSGTAEDIRSTDLSGTALTIGRGTDNDLQLQDHAVQLHHAVIQEEGGRYILRDLSLLSLTAVNGHPVKEAVLSNRGTIRIGPYELGFAQESQSAVLRIEYQMIEEVRTSDVAAQDDAKETPVVIGAAPARRPVAGKVNVLGAYRLATPYLNKTTLALAGLLVVVGIAVAGIAMDKRMALMPGPVSAKHASFVNECVRCHLPTSAMRTAVPDSTCATCHKSPLHFGEHSPAAPLACTACHLVHKGNTMLASATGKDCLRCHADLQVKNPTVEIHRAITDFGATHPEFAVMVKDPETGNDRRIRLDDAERLTDNAMMKLNHKLHLDPDLPGLDAGPLQCASCHQTASWKGSLMPPVTFDAACVQCHALGFDAKAPDKTVPHGRQPKELDLYLRALYASLWPLSEDAQAGGKRAALQEKVWIAEQVEKAEEKLFGKQGTRKKGQCQLCHINEPIAETGPRREMGADDQFPVLAATAIPGRWFLNSNFSHAAHTMTKCVACHEAAPQSEATTDVLLPKVTTCRACHDADGTASPSCLECHLFHEIPKPKPAPSGADASPSNF